MRKIRFGRTNIQVPAVSLGTWGHGGPNVSEGISVGWSGHDDALAKDALIAAYRNGITHWDTADAYGEGGHAESLIGDVWGEVPRREIFLATKFGWVKGPSGAKLSQPEAVRTLREHLVAQKDIKSECLAVASRGFHEGAYTFDAVDMCHTVRLGRWRVKRGDG